MDVVKNLFTGLYFTYLFDKGDFHIYAARVKLMSSKDRRYVFCTVSKRYPIINEKVHISLLGDITSIQTRTLHQAYPLEEQEFYFENKIKISFTLAEENETSCKYIGALPLSVTLLKNKKSYPSSITLVSALNTYNCVITSL